MLNHPQVKGTESKTTVLGSSPSITTFSLCPGSSVKWESYPFLSPRLHDK